MPPSSRYLRNPRSSQNCVLFISNCDLKQKDEGATQHDNNAIIIVNRKEMGGLHRTGVDPIKPFL
jgi:hypothetical protein